MDILAEIVKHPAKLDCLKKPSVLQLEMLEPSPFHIASLLIFIAAIIHTLLTYRIQQVAERLESKAKKRTIPIHLLFFLAQVETVFMLWVIPLMIAMTCFYNWATALEYINTRDYTEPLFVVVVLALSATRPIIELASKLIRFCAKLLGGSLSSWWFIVLTVGPILGSVVTETGAMALSALLLSRQFYVYRPSEKLAYATIALLFVNISVGGVITNFASPAVLVLSHCWNWSNLDMLTNFGWKAVLGILVANSLYWFRFRKELDELGRKKVDFSHFVDTKESKIPFWITLVHIFFIVWIVMISHYPAVFIASFLFFIGFHQITNDHQYPIRLSHPMLIGLFLAGLVIHGGLQGWWVVDLLYGKDPLSVMGVTIALTAFNDNTAISYLASLIPSWGKAFEYAVFTGIIAGGGLTVIANAPNPAGYTILKPNFSKGINPFKLLWAALPPTLILYAAFYFLGPLFHWFG